MKRKNSFLSAAVKKPMKILFMVQLPPPVHGASLRNLSLVESKLLQNSFDIRVLPLLFATSVDDIGKMSFLKIIRSFTYALRLIKTLLEFEPKIAYFTLTPTGGAFYRDVLFVFILRMFSVRIVYHLRGLGIRHSLGKNKFNRVLYHYVFKSANVVCLSKSHLRDVEGLPYKNHFVVHNGIKIEVDLQTYIPANEKYGFLFLSNFVKSKGVFEVIDSAWKLSSKRSDFRVLLVGAEVDVSINELTNYVNDLGLENIIEISGPRYGAQKFETILDCDALVFPTYYPFEVFPGVILEAMQCGKPVISTHHAVIADIVDEGKTGMLIPIRNADELADKMEYFITHKEEAERMGQMGKAKFIEEYTLDKFEGNMKDMFIKVGVMD